MNFCGYQHLQMATFEIKIDAQKFKSSTYQYIPYVSEALWKSLQKMFSGCIFDYVNAIVSQVVVGDCTTPTKCSDLSLSKSYEGEKLMRGRIIVTMRYLSHLEFALQF